MTRAAAGYSVLVIDSEGHTGSLLTDRIAQRGHVAHPCDAVADTLRQRMSESRFDALVIDYHLEHPDDLAMCEIAKGIDPSLPVIVITSPGVAARRLEDWNAPRRCIDQIIRKPLTGEALYQTLESMAGERAARSRAGRYASLIPEDGLRWADNPVAPALSECAVLFTDIRRSTEIVSALPLPEWFAAINRCLTDHGALVRENFGSVVKYTGDGLLASFRGRGRSHLALRCAAALQDLDRTASYRDTLRVGIGLAEGLVISGAIGTPGRQQYDVIGATVHLAARLCSIAAEGEIIATPRLVRAAGLRGAAHPSPRRVQLRGFPMPIDCISFPQAPPEHEAAPGEPA